MPMMNCMLYTILRCMECLLMDSTLVAERRDGGKTRLGIRINKSAL